MGEAGFSTRPKPWPSQSQRTGQVGAGAFMLRTSSNREASGSGSQTARGLCVLVSSMRHSYNPVSFRNFTSACRAAQASPTLQPV